MKNGFSFVDGKLFGYSVAGYFNLTKTFQSFFGQAFFSKERILCKLGIMKNRRERARDLFLKTISYSETHNDRWITECIYPGKRNGYFFEAGAADGRFGSSCYLLESNFDWKGICVEPHSEFFQKLKQNRPNSICENICLSEQSGQVIFIEGNSDPLMPYLSGIKSNLEQYKHHSGNILQNGSETIKASTTLEALLKKHKAPKIIDYAAFDIEGSEFQVLKDFPFQEYQFSALSLECDGFIWENITTLLTLHGYSEVKNPFNPDKIWERYWLHKSSF